MFSRRLPGHLEPNAFSQALARARADQRILVDLTETNPTRAGIPYPSDLLSSLADPRGLTYAPDPRGLLSAREVISRGISMGSRLELTYVNSRRDPKTSVLFSSTSEAYSQIFKLLCDPGDAVLVPQPSYPLFDLLTRLDAVEAAPYALEYHGAWWIDRGSLERAATPRTRAILVVSPNNPTGSMLRADDREWLVAFARDRQLALIADEVFIDYPLARRADAVSLAGEARALTFTLGGLSKSVGLPQLKLAWIHVSGPDAVVADALERLDVIADTYLSVSTPVQLAAAQLIEDGATIRHAIHARLRENLDTLRDLVRQHPAVSLYEPEGGWSAVLRVPAVRREEDLVLGLLAHAGVVVHPGFFFDFQDEAHLIVSLLPDPAAFRDGAARVMRAATEPDA